MLLTVKIVNYGSRVKLIHKMVHLYLMIPDAVRNILKVNVSRVIEKVLHRKNFNIRTRNILIFIYKYSIKPIRTTFIFSC